MLIPGHPHHGRTSARTEDGASRSSASSAALEPVYTARARVAPLDARRSCRGVFLEGEPGPVGCARRDVRGVRRDAGDPHEAFAERFGSTRAR